VQRTKGRGRVASKATTGPMPRRTPTVPVVLGTWGKLRKSRGPRHRPPPQTFADTYLGRISKRQRLSAWWSLGREGPVLGTLVRRWLEARRRLSRTSTMSPSSSASLNVGGRATNSSVGTTDYVRQGCFSISQLWSILFVDRSRQLGRAHAWHSRRLRPPRHAGWPNPGGTSD
jgi:hypothetical protein